MDSESNYLPGAIRDRLQDLMKSHKVSQAELATRIGCSEKYAEPLHQRQNGQTWRRKHHPYCACVQRIIAILLTVF